MKHKDTNMIRKIIAIAGSSSKGFNSDTMLEAFIEGARDAGAEVEKIYAYDLDIPYYEFARRIPLPEEKDLINLANKIKSAQGLVIATPTWNFGIPGRLKNIIDRIGFFALDYKNINMFGQPTGQLGYLKTFFIASGGAPWFFQKLAFFLFPPFYLRMIFMYYGAKMGGSIFGSGLAGAHNAKSDLALLERCKKAGMKYAESLTAKSSVN